MHVLSSEVLWKLVENGVVIKRRVGFSVTNFEKPFQQDFQSLSDACVEDCALSNRKQIF
jgi:hypothetical protein